MKAILSNQNSKNITIGGIGTSNTLVALVGASTDANTPSTLVKRNASGNFSAGTIIAELNGNSATTTKLATARTISITGDIYYTSPAFDGSNNVTALAQLPIVNDNPGSYGSSSSIPIIAVNSKGLVTSISSVSLSSGSGLILSISGNSGVGSVGLLNQTLTIIGDNNVSTAISGNTVNLVTSSTPSFSTISSTVATGTAPFIVTSTTPVANLSIGGNATNITATSNSTLVTLSSLSLPYSQLSSAPTIGDGALTISTVAAAATNNTVTLALSGAYSANSSTSRTLDLKVGPALTNLATLMTTAGAGFIKRGATADTYTIDTSTYLTASSNLDANNITTGIINVARLPTTIAGRFLLMGA
jgi:hypothetical protein